MSVRPLTFHALTPGAAGNGAPCVVVDWQESPLSPTRNRSLWDVDVARRIGVALLKAAELAEDHAKGRVQETGPRGLD